MPVWTYPDKARPGDRVAVLSPSAAVPARLPLPYELGVKRLTTDFGLEVVEYPTTRKLGATPAERAADIHAAFTDDRVKAVIASIGGDDQITVLPHLDRDLLRSCPKPFFGYSDNTNLLVLLWNLGIVGYHGGTVMVEFGRPGAMHPLTAQSLRAALFTSGDYELFFAREWGDVTGRWDDPETFTREPEMEPATGWIWHNADAVVEGTAWGGNLEALSWLLMADREIQPPEAYEGCVLFLETSEEMPRSVEVYRVLRNMGERGLLGRFPALLMGRARSWSRRKPLDPCGRAAHRAEQREAVLAALDRYAPRTLAVFDVDLGHTDPQVVVPCGGRVRVDGPARRITVRY
ncbi:S66 peptidase family protein [Streptomyces sp. NPDC101166]|uniref:S66 family peptidase n=1 Tax=Streptomyces sp. NPDC101166 TaxID=3366120 RepID=UPI003820C3C7